MVIRVNLVSSLAIAALLMFSFQTCHGIFEDQVGMFDWSQQYVGRVKFAEFQTQTQRKRVFVATEQNVVAALNLRTGEIAWRHALGEKEPIEGLRVFSKYVVTLSGGGRMLRAWSGADGVLIWDSVLPLPENDLQKSQTVELHVISEETDGTTVQDLVLLCNGAVLRVAATNGEVLWRSEIEASKLFVTPKTVFAAALHRSKGGAAADGITLTSIDYSSGSVTSSSLVASSVGLSPSEFLLTETSVVAMADSGDSLLTAALTDNSKMLLKTEIASLDSSFKGSASLIPTKLTGTFGVATESNVLVVEFGPNGGLKVAATYPSSTVLSDEIEVDGSFVFGVVHSTNGAEGEKVTVKVVSAAGRVEEGSEESLPWDFPHRGQIQAVHLNSYSRKSGLPPGYRLLVVGEDDSLALLQQGSVIWRREESLASIVDVKMVDLPYSREGAVETVEHSLEDWVKSHWLRAKATVMLATSDEASLVQQMRVNSADKNAPTRDKNGFRKLIVALTRCGKISALHSGDGRILWSLFAPPFRGSANRAATPGATPLRLLASQDPHRQLAEGEAPEVVVLGQSDGGDSFLSVIDGHGGFQKLFVWLGFRVRLAIQLPFAGPTGQRMLLLVDGGESPRGHVFPANQESLDVLRWHLDGIFFYLVDPEGGSVSGYGVEKGGKGLTLGGDGEGILLDTVALWRMKVPEGSETLTAFAARRPDEVVHTQTIAKSDRAVKFKYLNRNLLFVATETAASRKLLRPDEASVVVYIVDAVIGRVLHRVTHLNAQGPVLAVMSENWVVYSFFNLNHHRYEMTVLEMYDVAEQAGPADIAKYAFGLGGGNLTHPFTSWDAPSIDVQSQSYFFPLSTKTMAVTSTASGITTKQILVGTVSDQVLALDKRFLDPRRTVNPTQLEKEDGVIPYADSLPLNPQSYLTHGVQVEGLRSIVTEPSRLESTTLVFAYGIDLYYIRTAPSRTYDTLSEDFSYMLLLVTIVTLLVAIGVTSILAERKELQMRWK